jgi:hypothetical protein
MNDEINRINRILPIAPASDKTIEIKEWNASVLRRIEQYKVAHKKLLKEATTVLELALWKAKVEDESSLEARAKKVKIDSHCARTEARVTCGADIIIKNVLPFLQLK